MVAAMREMTLKGYEVYRFGGYEFFGSKARSNKSRVFGEIKDFFRRLFRKHGII